MQRLYNCPNCRAPVAPTQKFCGHCGTRLQPAQRNSVDTPMPVPYRTDFADPQIQGYQPRNHRMEDTAGQVNATRLPNKNTRPISREILKLLSSLVEKQVTNN